MRLIWLASKSTCVWSALAIDPHPAKVFISYRREDSKWSPLGEHTNIGARYRDELLARFPAVCAPHVSVRRLCGTATTGKRRKACGINDPLLPRVALPQQ
jgi:hypothetical protein